jgi:hypothetical protein
MAIATGTSRLRVVAPQLRDALLEIAATDDDEAAGAARAVLETPPPVEAVEDLRSYDEQHCG